MNRTKANQMNDEIAALARLKDSEIDTTDIPEMADWSEAVVGRFRHAEHRAIPEEASVKAGPELVSRIDAPATIYTGMTDSQLLTACLESNAKPGAAEELVRRYTPLIARRVTRMAYRWGKTSRDLTDELVQEVYFKLFSKDFRLLRNFVPHDENSLAQYLNLITTSVVHNFFRATAAKCGSNINKEAPAQGSELSSDSHAEMRLLMEEIDQLLKARGADTSSKRDQIIFHLFYRQGYTAKEIAEMPTIGLPTRKVENILVRLTRYVRRQLFTEEENFIQRPLSAKSKKTKK